MRIIALIIMLLGLSLGGALSASPYTTHSNPSDFSSVDITYQGLVLVTVPNQLPTAIVNEFIQFFAHIQASRPTREEISVQPVEGEDGYAIYWQSELIWTLNTTWFRHEPVTAYFIGQWLDMIWPILTGENLVDRHLWRLDGLGPMDRWALRAYLPRSEHSAHSACVSDEIPHSHALRLRRPRSRWTVLIHLQNCDITIPTHAIAIDASAAYALGISGPLPQRVRIEE